LKLKGGLLPFPRAGRVLYAKAILSFSSETRQIRPRKGMGRLRRVAGERYCTFAKKLADTVAGIRALSERITGQPEVMPPGWQIAPNKRGRREGQL
jgi:hypothetical protein